MDKNLHNIDDILSKAHKQFVEQAPDNAWERLQASLDKQDADKYKRRFIDWKRTAIFLFLLLSSSIIYEIGILNIQNRTNKNTGNIKLLSKKNNSPDSNIESHTIYKNADKPAKTSNSRSYDTETRVDLDTQKKTFFSPYTIFTDFNSIKTSNNLIPTAKNEIYDKRETKISIKSGVSVSDDETVSVIYDKSVIKIKKGNPTPKQVDKKDETTIVATQFLKSYEINTIPKTEWKVNITPGIFIKPVQPSIPINTEANFSKENNKIFNPYWTATPFISNDWGMYQLNNDIPDNTGNNQNEKEAVSKRERHESSYSVGVMITRQFSKHIGVKSGVIFSNTAIAILPQEIYAELHNGQIAFKYITSSGFGLIKPGFGPQPSLGDSIKSAEAQHNLQVISIPLSVSYRIDSKKFSIIPSAGLSANYIASVTVKTEVSDALNRETVNITGLDGMRQFYTGFVADLNVQYSIKNNLAVNLIPSFKYALSPITKNNVVKTFPYNFGLGAGLTFKF